MGWRGQQNRDDWQQRQWRALPLRERYNWPLLAFAFVVACLVLLFEAWAWGWF